MRTLLRRGAAVIVESQFQAADLSVDLVSRKVTRGATRITLTSKEFTLLDSSCVIRARCCRVR
ncbi:DNA-binding transcriptional activator CusR [Klebsiella pneumoniae]|uniref:DNA-binding transcriptional activator CusR n=1 Tax=Klebsiella pneumoniae TaxID=573 RepID=A0A377TKL3_KLEPN|nr:DNA-binding transcriptional activator CusR [Klebsiella pneumoniae]